MLEYRCRYVPNIDPPDMHLSGKVRGALRLGKASFHGWLRLNINKSMLLAIYDWMVIYSGSTHYISKGLSYYSYPSWMVGLCLDHESILLPWTWRITNGLPKACMECQECFGMICKSGTLALGSGEILDGIACTPLILFVLTLICLCIRGSMGGVLAVGIRAILNTEAGKK